MPSFPDLEAVHTGGGVAIEQGFFALRAAFRNVLEGVPQHAVAAALLVRRKIALQHAAVGAECVYAGFNISTTRGSQFFRRGWHIAHVKIPAAVDRSQTSDFDAEIVELCKLAQMLAPYRKDLVTLVIVGRNSEHASYVIENDVRLRKCVQQVG